MLNDLFKKKKKKERERKKKLHPSRQQNVKSNSESRNWTDATSLPFLGKRPCNLRPVPVPIVPLVPVLAPSSSSSPSLLITPFPPCYPSFLLAQIPIKHSAQTAGRWGGQLAPRCDSRWALLKTPREKPAVCPLRQPQLDSSSHVTPVKHSLDC